jgi:hypothetical protein
VNIAPRSIRWIRKDSTDCIHRRGGLDRNQLLTSSVPVVAHVSVNYGKRHLILVGDGKGFLFIRTITACGQPNHAPHVFVDVTFISQLCHDFTHKTGIYILSREGYELVRIVLITIGQSHKKFFATDWSAVHGFLVSIPELCALALPMKMALVCRVAGTLVTSWIWHRECPPRQIGEFTVGVRNDG